MEVKFSSISYRFLLLPLLFVLTCVGAFAQANSNVTGIVTDQIGSSRRRGEYYAYGSGDWNHEVNHQQRNRTVRHFRLERRKLQHESHSQGIPDIRAERNRCRYFALRSVSTSN